MIRFMRPPEPPGFDAHVKEDRERIVASFEQGALVDEEKGFPPHWEDLRYKALFRAAQEEKCGYCETVLQEVGAIDHFFPKGAIRALSEDPAEWGKELTGLTNVRGRKEIPVCEQGYYWLAYSWKNYVFCCERCNSAWKKAFFPVHRSPRALPPHPSQPDTTPLLNPFDDEAPWRHFDHDDIGQVRHAVDDDRGYESIRTYGLDRDSLRRARTRLVTAVLGNLQDYKNRSAEARRVAWEALCSRGSDGAAHAGMVRRMVEVALGVGWDQFVLAKPADELTDGPPPIASAASDQGGAGAAER